MLRPNGQLSMTAAYEGGSTVNPGAYHPAMGWHARVAARFGSFGKTASLPVGYGGRSIIFPRVAGSVASYRTPVTITGSAVGALGRGMSAAAAIQILADATGGLVAGGTASGTIAFIGSADIVAALKGEAEGTITFTALADAAALGFPAAAATVTVSGAGDAMGLGFMVATTVDSDQTTALLGRILSLLEADEYHTATQVLKKLRGTGTVLLTKNWTGTPLSSFEAVG